MKVFINGKVRQQGRVEDLIHEVVDNMSKRLGVPEGTEIAIEGLEFKVVFNIDGQETYATVPREINGETLNEIFMVTVHLDEDGNIVQAEDNEEESYYDGYTLAQAVGKDYEYEGVESAYNNDDLELIESLGKNSTTDVMSVRYKLKQDPTVEIVRHFKGDKLVAEYRYEPKEECEEYSVIDVDYTE